MHTIALAPCPKKVALGPAPCLSKFVFWQVPWLKSLSLARPLAPTSLSFGRPPCPKKFLFEQTLWLNSFSSLTDPSICEVLQPLVHKACTKMHSVHTAKHQRPGQNLQIITDRSTKMESPTRQDLHTMVNYCTKMESQSRKDLQTMASWSIEMESPSHEPRWNWQRNSNDSWNLFCFSLSQLSPHFISWNTSGSIWSLSAHTQAPLHFFNRPGKNHRMIHIHLSKHTNNIKHSRQLCNCMKALLASRTLYDALGTCNEKLELLQHQAPARLPTICLSILCHNIQPWVGDHHE